MQKIISENKEWIDGVWSKIEKKLSVTSELAGDKIPYTTNDGVFNDYSVESRIECWTNGFWPALMWLMYVGTKDDRYKEIAQGAEKKLDRALYNYECLHHDVGFVWDISAGVDYRLTGSLESKNRFLFAAATLAARYNPDGQFIRAWNGDCTGWTIIDCMMNIPILYRASEELSDPRFKQIAMHHADKTMNNHVRADGSVYHIVEYDVNTGEFIGTPEGQGYDSTCSSWSRGQSWALYGFVLSYIHTGEQKYLDTAKRVAHYFISAIADDGYIPKCDFRAPDEPNYIDTTAGAIAACGLIEIARAVPVFEKKLYLRAAVNILKALDEKECDWTTDEQSILQNGTESYKNGQHKPIIYGDYYFVEAIYKLKGFDMLFW